MNYHTLADFRVDQGELLDQLLAENVATLAACGLIDLSKLAQDGVESRQAGATSYAVVLGWRNTWFALARWWSNSSARLTTIRMPATAHPRGARTAAREREQRSRPRSRRWRSGSAARTTRENERKQTEKQKEPRASTTIQRCGHENGGCGFRPAFNVQIVSVESEQIVVTVIFHRNDRGLMQPMLKRSATARQLPASHLVDGGFAAAEDIEWRTANTTIYCPPTTPKNGSDPSSRETMTVPACSLGDAGWRVSRKSAVQAPVDQRMRPVSMAQLESLSA